VYRRKTKASFISLLLTYIIACWGIIQFVDWFCKRYRYDDKLVDALGLAFILFIPSMLLWSFLRSNQNIVFKKAQRFYVSNLIVLLIGTIFIISGSTTDSTTERIILKDETGIENEYVVSKPDYIRNIGYLPFSTNTEWTSIATPKLLGHKLELSPRINSTSPNRYVNYYDQNNINYFDTPTKIQQLELMKLDNLDYALVGKIDSIGLNKFSYEVTLLSRQKSDYVFTKSQKDLEFFDLIDTISQSIRDYIVVSDLQIESDNYVDVPSNQLESSYVEALSLFYHGLLLDQKGKTQQANSLVSEAIGIDKNFADAYLARAMFRHANNDQRYKYDFKTALALSSGLTQKKQLLIKYYYYYYFEESKIPALCNIWTTLNPKELYGYEIMINWLYFMNDYDNVFQTIEIAKLNGFKNNFLFQEAKIQSSLGNIKERDLIIKDFKKENSESDNHYFQLAKIYELSGDFNLALIEIEKYIILNLTSLSAKLLKAKLLSNLFLYSDAFKEIKSASILQKSKRDSFRYRLSLEDYYEARGKIKKSIQSMQIRWKMQEKNETKFISIIQRSFPKSIDKYIASNNLEEIESHIKVSEKVMNENDSLSGTGSHLHYYYSKLGLAEEFDSINVLTRDYRLTFLYPKAADYDFALSHKFNGRYDEAIQVLNKIDAELHDYDVKYELYDNYRLNGQYKIAIDGFTFLLEREPNNDEYRLGYIQSLIGMGNESKAKQELEFLFDEKWDNPDQNYIYYQQAKELDASLLLQD